MNEADTPTTMLPPASVPRAAPSGPVWYRDRWVQGFVVLALVGLLGVAYFMMPAQWIGRITPGHSVVDDGAVALTPGSARPTDGRIEITDLPTFDPVGEILFTTVGIDDQVTIRDWVRSVRDDAVFLRSREEVFGTRSAEEQREYNLQLMAVSKDSAVVAALRYLGVEAVLETGVGFNQVVADGPAASSRSFNSQASSPTAKCSSDRRGAVGWATRTSRACSSRAAAPPTTFRAF